MDIALGDIILVDLKEEKSEALREVANEIKDDINNIDSLSDETKKLLDEIDALLIEVIHEMHEAIDIEGVQTAFYSAMDPLRSIWGDAQALNDVKPPEDKDPVDETEGLVDEPERGDTLSDTRLRNQNRHGALLLMILGVYRVRRRF